MILLSYRPYLIDHEIQRCENKGEAKKYVEKRKIARKTIKEAVPPPFLNLRLNDISRQNVNGEEEKCVEKIGVKLSHKCKEHG